MANTPLDLDPTYQRLRQRVIEIENHLLRFELTLATSQNDYKRAQALENNFDLKSSFLETHTIHLNRQWDAIQKMKALYQKALHLLTTFEADWLLSHPSD